MPFGIPDTRQFPWDQPLANHLGQLMHPTYGGLMTVTTRPTVGVDGLALGAAHRGYTVVNTGTANIEQWDGTTWIVLLDSANIVKTASIDFYVNQTTGSDNNTGLTANSPWKTEAKLYQQMGTYNFMDAVINIRLGTGAYTLELPPNTQYSKVNIIGSGSANVKLGVFTIRHMQNVCITGLTLSAPGYASNVASQVVVTRDSTLHIGPDIVLGDSGQFVMYLNGAGTICLYPNCPIQVTGQCFRVFSMGGGGNITFMRYISTIPWGGLIYQPSVIPTLTATDTICKLNFVGTIRDVYDTIFFMSGAFIVGYQHQGSLHITGTTSNASAYSLNAGSFMYLSTVVGITPADRTISFPPTVQGGYKDASSTLSPEWGISTAI